MSTASQPAGQGQSAQQGTQPAQQGTQPAQQSRPGAAAGTSSWSTPRLLRLARAGAAAAVLLTGVAATGTFSTDGINATPDVITQQWVAAERAGVEMADADLRAAIRVAEGDPQAAREAFDAAVTQVGTDLTSSGMGRVEADVISREWSTFVLGAERAAARATADSGAEAEPAADAEAEPADPEDAATSGPEADYGAASYAAREAVARTDVAAEQHAQDLRTGSRSVLTGIIGTVSTLGLVGLLAWLALRTRRILNVPLVIATAITAGLTYLSINPSANPLTYDQRLEETAATATALQEVYQSRAAQHAAALGQAPSSPDDVRRTQNAVDELADPVVSEAWESVNTAQRQAADGGLTGEEAAELLAPTQEAFETAETRLRDRLDTRLSEAGPQVSRPAGITSGAALLLGLVGAVFAWTGLSRRLKEYR